ncbi:MAG: hypothetical protein ACR2JY_02470 [Chloroflexota bacterium]
MTILVDTTSAMLEEAGQVNRFSTGEWITMSKTIDLTDEQYAVITSAAAARGQSPALLIAEIAEELCDPEHSPPYYDTDGWFRHLGMTDEEIGQIKQEVRQEAESIADAS